MKTKTVHGTVFGRFDPSYVCEKVDSLGYIKYHDSDIYDEIPLKALRVRMRESNKYLVRNAIRIEIACRQIEEWRITGTAHT